MCVKFPTVDTLDYIAILLTFATLFLVRSDFLQERLQNLNQSNYDELLQLVDEILKLPESEQNRACEQLVKQEFLENQLNKVVSNPDAKLLEFIANSCKNSRFSRTVAPSDSRIATRQRLDKIKRWTDYRRSIIIIIVITIIAYKLFVCERLFLNSFLSLSSANSHMQKIFLQRFLHQVPAGAAQFE